MTEQQLIKAPVIGDEEASLQERLRNFPWWFLAIIFIAIGAIYVISSNENYNAAFNFIKIGLLITVKTTLTAYAIALGFGLLAGLGRISKNIFFNNLARLYVELIRGIPILVLIFFIALVGVPSLVNGLNSIGDWLSNTGAAFA